MSANEIGYGKPPVRTRFQKGSSGNPRGRPKNALTYDHRSDRSYVKDDILKVLQQHVPVNEAGQVKRVTRQRAMVKSLVNGAIKGNSTAIGQLWKLFKHFGLDKQPDTRIWFFRNTPGWQKLTEDTERILAATKTPRDR